MTKVLFDLETTGLIENLMERIICISCQDCDTGKVLSFCGADERKVITEFYDYLSKLDNPILIGYNSDSFDMPFLIRRSVVYGIKVPYINRTVDLRKLANGFKYSYNRNERGKLRDWAAVWGMPVETESGCEMFKLYTEGKFDEVQKHCEEDLKLTFKLLEHVASAGLLY